MLMRRFPLAGSRFPVCYVRWIGAQFHWFVLHCIVLNWMQIAIAAQREIEPLTVATAARNVAYA